MKAVNFNSDLEGKGKEEAEKAAEAEKPLETGEETINPPPS